MDFNKFTIKGQEAIQAAVSRVQELSQQTIEPIHLLGGILRAAEQTTAFLLQKTGANAQYITKEVEREESACPKVSGGSPYFSNDSNEVLNKAIALSKEMGDEYVSIEIILLALLKCKNRASALLANAGVDERIFDSLAKSYVKAKK